MRTDSVKSKIVYRTFNEKNSYNLTPLYYFLREIFSTLKFRANVFKEKLIFNINHLKTAGLYIVIVN